MKLRKPKTKKKTNEEKLLEIAELKKEIAKQEEEVEETEKGPEESEEETSPTDEEEEVPEIEPKEKTLVVKELPVQPVRSYVEKDGTIINMITVEEALTKLFESESSEK